MVATEHAAIREHGQVFGMLYASEYRIYGRFGYGPACREATWTLDAERTTFHGSPEGSVELVTPGHDARAALRSVFDAWRFRQVGEIRRRDHSWDFELGLRDEFWGSEVERLPGHPPRRRRRSGRLRAISAGGALGAAPATQHTPCRRAPRTDPDASAALWRFLAEVDWVATVKAPRRSLSDPLPWLLTNGRAAVVSDVGDGMWVRIFDVPRALETRTYDRETRVVLEVVDAEAPAGRLRVDLDAGPAGTSCRPTDRSPDLTLDVAALGAAYLGGTRLRDAVLVHGVDEHRNGALAAVEALLRMPDEPWCSTFF